MTFSVKKIMLHLGSILLAISFPIITSPDFDFTLHIFHIPQFLKGFIGVIVAIIFFYVHHFWLIKYYEQKKWLQYGLLFLGFIGINILTSYFFTFTGPDMPPHEFGPEVPINPPPFRGNEISVFFLVSSFLPLFIAVLLSLTIHSSAMRKKRELEMVQTGLQNLKYQLQPHFLFNNLNNLYSVSILSPEKTPDYILELSEILRYLMLTEKSSSVELEKDVQFCKHFIDLQKLRFGDKSKEWDISFPENNTIQDVEISPTLLIPLIENVFKYGVNYDKPSPIKIHLTYLEGVLNLETYNKKNNIPGTNLLESQKLGLKKTIQRLKLLYPYKYTVDVQQTDDEYKLVLKIDLKK